MHLSPLLLLAAPLSPLVSAASAPHRPRALLNSLSGGYAPTDDLSCPSGSLVRTANSLAPGEQDFLKKRRERTNKALRTLLRRANIPGLNVNSFLDDYTPTIGLAFSGGGHRALMSGGGALKALDDRTKGTDQPGQLGGLLQSSTYLAGLSGGSWLVGSVILNNYTTVSSLQSDSLVWDFTSDRLSDILKDVKNIIKEVRQKAKEGFDVTITDIWARLLSQLFIRAPDGGPAMTWSSIALTSHYKSAEIPYPLVVADGRNPGELNITANATVYEFSPIEMGSFDPQLYAFTKLEYLGSNVTAGKPVTRDSCVKGFDNAGFVIGTSASLFNYALQQVEGSSIGKVAKAAITSILEAVSDKEEDIADYSPNPFFGINERLNPSAKTRDLTLVDGGLDMQNVPLHPLIQPPRKVDVIFAFDNSADLDVFGNWPSGLSLIASYERSLRREIANGTLFPPVPDQNTFLAQGLNNRATLFGCDRGNFSDPKKAPPLIVYLPNAPWSFHSNVSTTTATYTNEERDAIIDNGWNVATQGNSTEWAKCVGCAIVRREMERKGTEQPEECKKCFEKYCWDGKRVKEKQRSYDPKFKAKELKISAAGRVGGSVGSLIAAVAVGLVLAS